MDLEAMQQAITRALAANAQAAMIAKHQVPRSDIVCRLCLRAHGELQELMRIVTEAKAARN